MLGYSSNQTQENNTLNQEKLAKLQAQVCIGRKGTACRKKAVRRITTKKKINSVIFKDIKSKQHLWYLRGECVHKPKNSDPLSQS